MILHSRSELALVKATQEALELKLLHFQMLALVLLAKSRSPSTPNLSLSIKLDLTDVDKLITPNKMSNTSKSTIHFSKKELAQKMATHSPLDLNNIKFQAEVLSALTKSTSSRKQLASIKLDQRDADKSRLTRPMLHQPSHLINHSSQELAPLTATQNPLELNKSILEIRLLVPLE